MMPLSAPKITLPEGVPRFEGAHRAHHYTEEEWKKITVRGVTLTEPMDVSVDRSIERTTIKRPTVPEHTPQGMG